MREEVRVTPEWGTDGSTIARRPRGVGGSCEESPTSKRTYEGVNLGFSPIVDETRNRGNTFEHNFGSRGTRTTSRKTCCQKKIYFDT